MKALILLCIISVACAQTQWATIGFFGEEEGCSGDLQLRMGFPADRSCTSIEEIFGAKRSLMNNEYEKRISERQQAFYTTFACVSGGIVVASYTDSECTNSNGEEELIPNGSCVEGFLWNCFANIDAIEASLPSTSSQVKLFMEAFNQSTCSGDPIVHISFKREKCQYDEDEGAYIKSECGPTAGKGYACSDAACQQCVELEPSIPLGVCATENFFQDIPLFGLGAKIRCIEGGGAGGKTASSSTVSASLAFTATLAFVVVFFL